MTIGLLRVTFLWTQETHFFLRDFYVNLEAFQKDFRNPNDYTMSLTDFDKFCIDSSEDSVDSKQTFYL